MYRKTFVAVLILTLSLAFSSVGIADQAKKDDEKTPSATFTMKTETVALVLGSTTGKGVLTYQGKEYPFTISGLSFPDVGGSVMEATGKVFNMKKLSDFEGPYSRAEAGATIIAGANNAYYHKDDGVYITLTGTTEGFRATLAAGGIELKLDK